jgi:hypothetical protein
MLFQSNYLAAPLSPPHPHVPPRFCEILIYSILFYSILFYSILLMRMRAQGVTPEKVPQKFSNFWRKDVKAHRNYYRSK